MERGVIDLLVGDIRDYLAALVAVAFPVIEVEVCGTFGRDGVVDSVEDHLLHLRRKVSTLRIKLLNAMLTTRRHVAPLSEDEDISFMNQFCSASPVILLSGE